MNLPVFLPRMRKIRHNHTFKPTFRHLRTVFTGQNDEFEAPGSGFWEPETPTYCGAGGVRQEAEAWGEESVVDLCWSKALCEEREVGVG